MALKLYDKITPSGDFALIDAENVELESGQRLDEFLKALTVEIDYESNLAFDTEELVVGFYKEIDYDDEGTGDNPAPGSSAILGVAILGQAFLWKE